MDGFEYALLCFLGFFESFLNLMFSGFLILDFFSIGDFLMAVMMFGFVVSIATNVPKGLVYKVDKKN